MGAWLLQPAVAAANLQSLTLSLELYFFVEPSRTHICMWVCLKAELVGGGSVPLGALVGS